MVNSYSVEVADFMRTCGIERKPGYNDCIDYVENELEFAALLAESPTYLAEQGKDALGTYRRPSTACPVKNNSLLDHR